MTDAEAAERARLYKKLNDASDELMAFEREAGYADVLATVAALEVFVRDHPDPRASEMRELLEGHPNLTVRLSAERGSDKLVSVYVMHYVGSSGAGEYHVGATFSEAAHRAIEKLRLEYGERGSTEQDTSSMLVETKEVRRE